MNIDTIPLFSMLRSRLGYLTQREGLISQNVANASTPNYAPRDLDGFSFSGAMAASEGGSGAGGLEAAPAAEGHIALGAAKPGGACILVGSNPCCSHPAPTGLGCAYPGGCTKDADCPAGSCTLDTGKGVSVCGAPHGPCPG